MQDLPDEPRWVEANGIVASGEGWREPIGAAGVAIGHDGAQLMVLGNVAADGATAALAAVVAAHPGHAVVFPFELAGVLAALDRPSVRALIHVIGDDAPGLPVALPELDGAVLLPDDAALDHLPVPLRDELVAARARGRDIWTAYVDGAPVTFAHASWRSPRWFDVAVDTLPAARQLGLATLAAAALIRAERALGREPVWGADEDNRASRALARRLGFAVVDEIGVAPPW